MSYINSTLSNIRLYLFIFSWFASIASIIWNNGNNIVTEIGIFTFALFCILTIPYLRLQSYLIVFFLLILGFLIFEDIPSNKDLILGGKFVLIFAGLIPTMSLVRSAAQKFESIKTTQMSLANLSSKETAAGFQITGHIFGGVINTGVFSILAAAIPPKSDQNYRKIAAEASIRGMVSSATWSPFFVAFAIGQVYIDTLNSWIGLSIGIIISIVFIFFSIMIINPNSNFKNLGLVLSCLTPVGVLLISIIFIVLTISIIFKLTALSAVITVMPVLVVIKCLFQPSISNEIRKETLLSMRKNIDDVLIITLAMFIGYFVSNNNSEILSNWSGYFLFIPEWFVLIFIPLSMALVSMIGIHPVISSTFLLSIFTGKDFNINLALIMQAHLIGWCAGTISSVASLSVLTSSALFKVPTYKLAFGVNALLAILLSILGGVILNLLSFIFI